MTQWEYCKVSIGWPSGLGGNYFATVTYFGSAGDTSRSVKIPTTISKMKLEEMTYAIGHVLGRLGAEGWELVTFQRENTGSNSTPDYLVFLKRQIQKGENSS